MAKMGLGRAAFEFTSNDLSAGVASTGTPPGP
jgi:hypothetical protein